MSRGIRHSHRDGGAGRGGAAASKAGAGNGETKMPTRLEMLLDMPTVSRETQIKNAWNSESQYQVYHIMFTPLTCRRGQIAEHFRQG